MINVRKWFGDKSFYKMALAIAVPIMIQNGVTNFVGLLDNIMVGQLSTESMSGVSIVNQFIFVFYLAIFGGLSGPGIYTAQFHGSGNKKGEKQTFIFKLYFAIIATVVGLLTFSIFGTQFIQMFLHDGSVEGDLALTLSEGQKYLHIMLIGFMPYALSNAYAATLRETGETLWPMIASVAAVGTNFLLNLVLIFGIGNVIPAMGVTGAAIATVVSRFVEFGILFVWTLTHKERCGFIQKFFSDLRIPKDLSWQLFIKCVPLLFNELFWSLSLTMRNQCFSLRGLDAVAAQNIATTLSNLMSVVYLAVGTTVSIIIGNLLGAGKTEEAKATCPKLVMFSVLSAFVSFILIAVSAPFFPLLFNTTDVIRHLATYMLYILAITLPFDAVANASYFCIRAGGKILVTILMDSGFNWAVIMTTVAICAYFTPMNIHWLFAVGQGLQIVKSILFGLVLKNINWARTIVSNDEAAPVAQA